MLSQIIQVRTFLAVIAEGSRCNRCQECLYKQHISSRVSCTVKKNLRLRPFETLAGSVTKLFCQSYAVRNPSRGIIEKKSPESLKSYSAGGVNIFGARENEPLMK